jgi:hypothetical protein
MRVSVAFLLPAVALLLAGCEEKLPKGDPAQQVSPGRAGTRAGWDIALDLSMKPHFIQTLVSGFKHEHHALPKSIGYVPAMPNCVYAGPEAGSKVVYLTASRGQISSNIHTFNTKEVREAAEQFVKDWRTAGEERRVGLSSSLAPLAIMNVVVTDTSAPIHLVLGGPKAVFNLQLAPGARVSGVSLIGVEDIGVANLPEGVPLNAMGPAAVKRCGAEPFMRPKPDWQLRPRQRDDDDRRRVSGTLPDRSGAARIAPALPVQEPDHGDAPDDEAGSYRAWRQGGASQGPDRSGSLRCANPRVRPARIAEPEVDPPCPSST